MHSAVYAVAYVCLSVRHKPVLYRNGVTDQADFQHTVYHRLILYTLCKVIRVSANFRVGNILPSGNLDANFKFLVWPPYVDHHKCCQLRERSPLFTARWP